MIQPRQAIQLPEGKSKLLLHSCCAPCAGDIMESLRLSDIDFTIFFYNPNIHPRDEYEIRKAENKRFADKHHLPCIDGDYDKDDWFERIRGTENEPERGKRCTLCFDMRFECSALYAIEHGFDLFSSTLGISRWKNMSQINECGLRAAARYSTLDYWTFNWRKKGGSQRMIELAKQEKFYQQEYCGCVFSLRDTNLWRKANNRPRIQRGTKFYTDSIITKNGHKDHKD